MQRHNRRGIRERTKAKNVRSDDFPSRGIANGFYGDTADIHTTKDGKILKFKAFIGITPCWMNFSTGVAFPTRGESSRGVGLGTVDSVLGSPLFLQLPVHKGNLYLLQASLSVPFQNRVGSHTFKGGNIGTANGSAGALFARGNTYNINNLPCPIANRGQMRKPGVFVQNTILGTDRSAKPLYEFNGVRLADIFVNPLATNILQVSGSFSYLFENADFYSQLRYFPSNTNLLNNVKSIMQQRQLSKSILNTFANSFL